MKRHKEYLDDIVSFIETNFLSEQIMEVFDLLQIAKDHTGKAANDRMIRCALYLSKANLEKLKYNLDGLSYDCRDVILAAEYKREKGNWIQVRDLSKPFLKN